jgi:hypothetical protein
MSPANRVEEPDARVSIHSLKWFLDVYSALPTVVENDQRWRDFAQKVRNRLPRYKPGLPNADGPL